MGMRRKSTADAEASDMNDQPMGDKPRRNLATIAHGSMMPASCNRQQCEMQQTASKLAMQDTKETTLLQASSKGHKETSMLTKLVKIKTSS